MTQVDDADDGASQRLDRLLVGSVAWVAVAKWSGQLLSWVSTLIVARILGPANLSILGMASLYLGLVGIFTEFGISVAVITIRTLDDRQLAQLNTLSFLLGVGGLLVSWLLAVPVAAFFHTPELIWVLVAISANFVIQSFRTVPVALLQRDLKFNLVAVTEATRVMAQGIATIVAAVAGLSYWSLVVGSVVGNIASSAVTLVLRSVRFGWPQMRDLAEPLLLGRRTLLGGLSWAVYTDADFIVAGRMLGQAPLGVYTLAWNLASVPLAKITEMVTAVTPSFFAKVQHDAPLLQRYLLRITEVLSLVTFPVTIGMALVAPDFVAVVLGSPWLPAVVPLQLLAIHACLRSIVTLLPQALTAVGEARFVMISSIVTVCVLPVCFVIGSRWGTVGIASVWVLVYPFVPLALWFRLSRVIDLDKGRYVRALMPAGTASAVMAAAVLVARFAALGDATPVWRLAGTVAVGVLVYAGTLLLLHRQRVIALVQFARWAPT